MKLIFVIVYFVINMPFFAQFVQPGAKLVGSETIENAQFGRSVSLSGDGNTIVVGGSGSIWIFARKDNSWLQVGNKISRGSPSFGNSVSISFDGKTIVAGDPNISETTVFESINGEWVLNTNLVGSDSVGYPQEGTAVAISEDGNTIIIGGPFDNNNIGAAWIFVKDDGIWTQQGNKLVGTESIGIAAQGYSVSLSYDGNTAIIGRPFDNSFLGAFWIFIRENGFWKQQGNKIICDDYMGTPHIGCSVSLSADGNTALIGGDGDNDHIGAAWIFTRSNGVWTQQGNKLVGTGIETSHFRPMQGTSVSLSSDGNIALVSGNALVGKNGQSAAWIFTRTNNMWSQFSEKLVGEEYAGNVAGASVSVSGDGNTVIVGSPYFNNNVGVAWIFSKSPTGIHSEEKLIPKFYTISSNYPNPFNPSTKIKYDIPKQSHVKLVVYDILGREIEILVDKEMSPGSYEVTFNVETLHATSLPSGVYFYKLITESFLSTKKMILIR